MPSIYRNRCIRDQADAVRRGEISAHDLTLETRAEIARYEANLKAWVTLRELEPEPLHPHPERAREEAAQRPLEGVSLGVKDIIDVAGLPTRSGSPVTSEAPAENDAACITRFRELGAVIQGKTVTTEFGYFSPGPTTNPWDHTRTPGGSSSGSAAAVGANTIPVALGTQTAGSLTRPAAYCGTAGMVLPPGSTDMAGISGLSETLDSLGLLTRTVSDLEYVYSAFTGQEDVSSETVAPETVLHVWDGSDLLPLAPQMQGLLHEIPRLARDLGIISADLQWSDHIMTLTGDHRRVMAFEAARTLETTRSHHQAELSPQLRELLVTGEGISEQTRRESLTRRDISLRELERVLGATGVIIGPAAQGEAPDSALGTGSPDLSRPWQLLGLPTVTVPGARSTSGMPLGLQLIGLQGSEANLLALGKQLEALLRRLPSFSEDTPQPTLKDLTW